MNIRTFDTADFTDVSAIYQEGIDGGNATFALKTKTWPEWDAAMLPSCRLVAEIDHKRVGWAGLSATSTREAYAGVVEVSIYVSDKAKGNGVGYSMLCELITQSESAGFWTLQAAIFTENQASIKLHQKCGFKILGVRERLGKIHGVWRDVVLMERRSDKVGI
ncbi:phosphinothricin N-acetyltransferase [Shewanella hanedai]|uniref:N-acetyltransferase n=1 Tax=Shewanella hanedai TaxID=25 RepID=A0A553JQP1_SHEHA|nr:GNAT family N-acetyltransferase [Shewanella hanedai]TRY14777.1 N-acetyltransferase [Shewanella hanedai]GGI76242.1 phosphinothricin N-acetyltransferase [Shewanella hanedai]